MKTYFLRNGSRESGPFMLDDLKYQRISRSTMIKEGNGEWGLITENRDLRFLLDMNGGESTFSNSQTTTAKQSKASDFDTITRPANTAQNNPKSKLIILVALILFFVIAGMAFAIFSMTVQR